MLYLSKLLMDTSHPAARQNLRNANDMHKTVMRAFADIDVEVGARKALGVLYRLEYTGEGKAVVYVQSKTKPDIRRWLETGYLAGGNGSPQITKDITALRENIFNDMIVEFDLLASPTKKIGSSTKEERLKGNKKNGRRVLIKDPYGRLDWLRRKGELHGFEVIRAMETEQGKVVGTRIPGASPILQTAIRFQGLLKIADSNRFNDVLVSGVGPGKSYGIGMMMFRNWSCCDG